MFFLLRFWVYHNSLCGKSRERLVFLENSGQEYEIIKYLEDVPTFEKLKGIVKKLALKHIELVGQKKKIWIENFKGKTVSDDDIIQAMIENRILIERPIVVNGNKVVIARPLEKVFTIINSTLYFILTNLYDLLRGQNVLLDFYTKTTLLDL